MNLKQNENGSFSIIGKNTTIKVPDILLHIKKGSNILIKCHPGYDITIDFLIKRAIGVSNFRYNADGECHLLEFLRLSLDEDVFYDIIRSGGLNNFLTRR